MDETHFNGGQLAVTSYQCELTSPSLASRSGNDSVSSSSNTDHLTSATSSTAGTTNPPVGLLDRIKSLSFGRFKKQPHYLASSKSSPNTPTAEAEDKQTMKHGRKRRILSHLCASISTDSEHEASINSGNEGAPSSPQTETPSSSSSSSSNVGQISRPLHPTNLIVDKANDPIEFTPSNLPMTALNNQMSSSHEPNNNTNSETRQFEAMASRSHLMSPYPYLAKWNEPIAISNVQPVPVPVSTQFAASGSIAIPRIHTQIDFVHRFVPDLLEITNFPFYWGKMDRYEAEKLLEKRPEGTFLLRDSAQEDYLFSVSFRRFHRSLHARIEQSNNKFSFDSHDPGVYSSNTVCGLIKHYKDPNRCMFFEPMLTLPLNRNFPFSLQHLARATICSNITYDSVDFLPLPKRLKLFLQEYHYKQKVNVRRFD